MRFISSAVFGLLLIACGEASTSEAAEESTAAPVVKGNWQVDADTSSVKFRASQDGSEFEGEFKKFTAEINLDPDGLEGAYIRAVIDIASVDAGSDDRNGALPTREWFHVKNFPVATFASDNISSTGDGTYVAKGDLAIKGVTKQVSLPFTLTIDEDDAVSTAELDLSRLEYGLGPKADWVDKEVAVLIEIKATRLD